MTNNEFEELSLQYIDVLREIGNIGAGNATTALATMLDQKVDMGVPKADLMTFKEIGEFVGGEETVMAGVYMGVEGDINGSMMFLLQKNAARHLVDKMLMGFGDPDPEVFGEMEMSALREVGNIITGAYLNSLSDLTHMKIYPTPPDITIDMAGAILSVPAIQFGMLGDKILMIQTRFMDEQDIDGYFILIPDMESYHKILASLGMC